MGVTGSGTTLIGRALAAELGWPFADADDFHSDANIARMRAGVALDDEDRRPWLNALHDMIARTLDRREHLALACSALKERYRQVLRGGFRSVRFVHLAADEETLRKRLASRPDHFAGVSLVASQLATLEPPADALTIDATCPPERILGLIRHEFGL